MKIFVKESAETTAIFTGEILSLHIEGGALSVLDGLRVVGLYAPGFWMSARSDTNELPVPTKLQAA